MVAAHKLGNADGETRPVQHSVEGPMTETHLNPGLRDELITLEMAEILAAIEPDQLVEDRLHAGEAIERLGKHLLRVSRRLRDPNDNKALAVRTEEINGAIAALGVDFEGDRVALPPRLLKGVRPAGGLTQGALPSHPAIPLTASELLVNGAGEPGFGNALKEEIRCAEEVDLICAFVGYTGFQPLKDEFRALIERGGRIRVITSTYLGSTSAKALDELVSIGAEVRVNYQGQATKLHAKAWLFRRPGELDTACVGSSNLSDAALYSGLEWNVRLARADAPGVFGRIQQTFESYWHSPVYEAYSLADRTRLDAALLAAKGYAHQAISRTAQRTIDQLNQQLADAYGEIDLQPKPHQRLVLDTLQHRRESFDEHRHLVVAATGTGKTVIAALDYARLCKPGRPRPRLLFVAHRAQILEQARATFRKALKDPHFGELVAGNAAAPATDAHVFAMVQTLQRRIATIPRDHYDVIYIDEAHHGTAESWKQVIEHFTPSEIVGLTATPERTDGVGIADLFGGEYTTELRLWEAVDDQLLVPFEYVGVDDGTDLRQLAWHRGDYAVGELASLYTGDHERVRRIIEAMVRWIDVPQAMRALGFCVNVAHAQFMAEEFTRLGFAADYLQGDHDQEHRDAVLARLKAGELQVVFSVDVLGEGIDIPDVDTLLLLRPTQSPVLFAQQLGRGLRTAPGKPTCLVLDFIGQHRTEYRFEERFRALVNPTRGSLREQAEQEFPFLPAGSSITLERVARERVLARLKEVAPASGPKGMVKELVRTRADSLQAFLTATERTTEQFYATDQRKMSWTRLQRAAALPGAPAEPADLDEQTTESSLLRRIGFLQHVTDPVRTQTWAKWLEGTPPQLDGLSEGESRIAMQLLHLLGQKPTTLQAGFDLLWRSEPVRAEIIELLDLTKRASDTTVANLDGLDQVPLLAHARYTRAEVFAAMGISSFEKPKEHREGVYFDPERRTQLMFVTLNKDESSFASHIRYKDHALSPDLFHWESPNNWRQDTKAMLRCIGEGPEASEHRLLFVRERSSGGIEGTFRCFGQVDLAGKLEGNRPVALTWRLRQPLPEVIFEATQLLATG